MFPVVWKHGATVTVNGRYPVGRTYPADHTDMSVVAVRSSPTIATRTASTVRHTRMYPAEDALGAHELELSACPVTTALVVHDVIVRHPVLPMMTDHPVLPAPEVFCHRHAPLVPAVSV